MVAFRPKDLSKIARIMNEPQYAWSMNFGDSTFHDGTLQVDHRGDYPEFTDEQIATIKLEGFERADTFWYEISPPPQNPARRRDLVRIFEQTPSSTIQSQEGTPSLQFSFTKALTDGQIEAIHTAGMKIKEIPTVPLRVAPL